MSYFFTFKNTVMLSTFLIISCGLLGISTFERYFPNHDLERNKNWICRAIFFNAIQIFISLLSHFTWENLMIESYNTSIHFTPFIDGFLAYLVITWVFYWWHRIRHESKTLWLIFHQFHHSPENLEVLTSFYKHPFEIILNVIIIGIIVYPILGLCLDANMWLTIFSAYGEAFYHMNIKTPYWMGFIIQRPESHRVHHLRDKRFCKNYSDVPLWDILGGTFYNPRLDTCETGFSQGAESKVMLMLRCKDVINKKRNILKFRNVLAFFLLFVGCLQFGGYIFGQRSVSINVDLAAFNNATSIKFEDCNTQLCQLSRTIRGLGVLSAAAPLPLVFSSYNGYETFATRYAIDARFSNGTISSFEFDSNMYDKLLGPYNRKNVFGVIFSYGPFFTDNNMIKIRQQILDKSICKGLLLHEFGIMDNIMNSNITVTVQTKGHEEEIWQMMLMCQ
jgi:sterol desaturase/sphingolipid hydroxylase (fatty acid hydroxylase superfamily)